VIWAQGRNISSAYDVRRVVAALQWPTDPISLHLASPDLPAPVLHDPDPMRIVRREGGTITPDGGPLTTAALVTGPGNGGISGWPCSSQHCPSRPSRP
jgi:hypothetical protein